MEADYPTCDKRLVATKDRQPHCGVCFHPDSDDYKLQIDPEDCWECPLHQDVPNAPPLTKRILTYAQAVAEWTLAGRPTRSDEEVERLYNQHCKGCSWRKKRTNVCRGCGCRVAAYGMAVVNKLKMATQHCPRKLF